MRNDAPPNLCGDDRKARQCALLIVDMISDFEFPDGERLYPPALEAARHIVRLKRETARRDLPVIYCNDNWGRWRSDFRSLVDHSLDENTRGAPIARLLKPVESDYFVLKPKLSAFFSTTLETLLRHLQVKELVISGVATDMCVLFTVHDAYLRDFALRVPRDAVAAIDSESHHAALRHMERTLGVITAPSAEWCEEEN